MADLHMTSVSLRDRLRADTRAQHTRLDDLISRFDVGTVTGLSRFLTVHHAGFSGLHAALSATAETKKMLGDLVGRLSADMTALDVTPATVTPDISAHPDAIGYVALGSRMGSKVLRKRWKSSSDPKVTAASAYFTSPDYLDAWRAYCTRTEQLDGDSDSATQIVEDADRIFESFAALAMAQLRTVPES